MKSMEFGSSKLHHITKKGRIYVGARIAKEILWWPLELACSGYLFSAPCCADACFYEEVGS